MHHSFTPPVSKQLGGGGGEGICSHIHEGPRSAPSKKARGVCRATEAVQGLCDSRAGCWDAKPAGRGPARYLGLLVLEKELFLLEMQT